MSIRLDPPRRIGARRVAALVSTRIDRGRWPGGVSVFADKRPVAILIAEGATVRAFRPDGAPMTLAEVDVLCPGAVDRVHTGGA